VAADTACSASIDTVTVRLVPRHKVRRAVEVGETANALIARFRWSASPMDTSSGTSSSQLDPASDDFLRRGIFSCYRPSIQLHTYPRTTARAVAVGLEKAAVARAPSTKQGAWDAYTRHYLATNGQVYWSDTHQLSTYIDD
jgi:hypothetical protein